MSNIPDNLKYTATHEWVREEQDGSITIGITDHAQELLGDVVFVELPALQKAFTSGEGVAVIESVKAAADVYAPLRGEVIAVNEMLHTTPESINKDPYGEGWLCRMRITDTANATTLMNAEQYQHSIEEL